MQPDQSDASDSKPTYTRGGSSEWTTAIVPIITRNPRDVAQRLNTISRKLSAHSHLIDPDRRVTVNTDALLSPTEPFLTEHDFRQGVCDDLTATSSSLWSTLTGDPKKDLLTADKRIEAVKQYLRKMPGGVDQFSIVFFSTGTADSTVRETLSRVADGAARPFPGRTHINHRVISLHPDYLDFSPQVAPSTEEKESVTRRAKNATGFFFGLIGSMVSSAQKSLTPADVSRRWHNKRNKGLEEWNRQVEPDGLEVPPVEVKQTAAGTKKEVPTFEEDTNDAEGRQKLRAQLNAIEAAEDGPGWSQTYLNPSNWSVPTSARVRSTARSAASYLDPQSWYDWYREHGTDDPISNKSRRQAKSLVEDMVNGQLSWYERYPGWAGASIKSYSDAEPVPSGSVVYTMKTHEPTLTSLASTIYAQEERMKQNHADALAKEAERRREHEEAKRMANAEAARLQAEVERQAAAATSSLAGQQSAAGGSTDPYLPPGPPAA
jgi:hypothetical protein